MLAVSGPEGGILELALDRPARLNALTMASTQALLDRVRAAREDDTVRVILLRGEGRAFCAGKDRDDPAGPEFVALLQALATALMACPKPIVVAAHGWVVGAGLEILLNCDIAVAARSARFMLPETTIGLFGTGGVLALLPRHVGTAKAKGALMLGQEFSAQQADRWGLVWSVVDDDRVLAEARAIARRLAGSDPKILGHIKALVQRETIGDLGAVLAREAEVHRDLMGR